MQLDCAAAAIVLAAAMAMPKPAFRSPSPLVQPTFAEYNELVRVVAEGRRTFDRGGHSEPLSCLSLYAALQQAQAPKAKQGRTRVAAAATASAAAATEAVEGEEEEEAAAEEAAAEASAAEDGGEATEAISTPVSSRRKPRTAREGGGLAALRVDQQWCQKHGLAPRQVRMLCSTVGVLVRVVSRELGLPAEQLRFDGPAHLKSLKAREASFNSARLRALLVWAFPDVLLCAHRPKSSARSRRPPAASGGGGAGDGIGGDVAADGGGAASVHLGAVLSEKVLTELLIASESPPNCLLIAS